MRPVVLEANRFERFYRGGRAIEAFRGLPAAAARLPEDWVASATTTFEGSLVGLTRLPDGRLLRDAVDADPVGWLGADHVGCFGPSTSLLVKLLDAGERLPVHCHPDDEFAARHLGCPWGKTEAWVIAGTATADALVHLGFTHDVDPATLRDWVERQAVDEMLDAMHAVPVRPGDGVLVPAGLPHAIGSGIFLVELQQPTDLSVLLEWDGFAIDGPVEGHLGLGFDVALGCVDRTGLRADDLAALRCGRRVPAGVASTTPALPERSSTWFRAERVQGDRPQVMEPGFSVLVVLNGSGLLRGAGFAVPVERGMTLVVPHGAGATTVGGGADLEIIRCRPPEPVTPGTARALRVSAAASGAVV